MDASSRKYEHIEFYCSECQHYTYVNLCLLEGEHVMACPNCGHEHYRHVTDGKITEKRWSTNKQAGYKIIAPKSACVPKEQRRQLGLIAQVRQSEAAGVNKHWSING